MSIVLHWKYYDRKQQKGPQWRSPEAAIIEEYFETDKICSWCVKIIEKSAGKVYSEYRLPPRPEHGWWFDILYRDLLPEKWNWLMGCLEAELRMFEREITNHTPRRRR